ncbi:MAG: two-component regulator propeller domain-containing protein [Crocinitomicaceae bacterium]|nr:two-component regulator propeller domain-containing protein [Crocinitomicaceae bacterium]
MKIQFLTAGAVLLVSNLFAQTFTNYTTSDGLLHDNVNCLDVDATDNLWFGTQDGVSVFNGSIWGSYTTADGLVDNTIQAIYVANSGDVWAGTDFGVSVWSTGVWTSYTTADGLGNNQIKCISEDLNGDIWFGTNNGASEFDGTNWTNYGTAEGLPFGGVTTISAHANGDLWMGSGLGGMMIFDGSSFTAITTAEGLIDDRIRGLVIDGSDNKWVATSEGITVLDNTNSVAMHHTTIFTLPAPDTLNPIEDIEMDGQGNIWVGVYVDYLVTEGGVCAYDGSQWIEYHVADGLIGPVVRALAIDGNDDVWVATSTGVSKISDHNVGVDESEALSFSIYPNPAIDVVNIASANEISGSIELFTTSMQLVKSIEVIGSQENLQLNVGDLSAGIYFIRIGETTQKIMLK